MHAFCSTKVGSSGSSTIDASYVARAQANGQCKLRRRGWLFLNVFDKIDKLLMRLTNARLSTAIGTALSKNAILLSCTGAKSGVERDAALLCTPSGDDIVLVA